MSVSKTSICNKALRKLGAKALINIDTDTSPEATLCKASYDTVLLEVLRMHNWNFAIFRQSLNLDASGTPVFQYTNRFILPTIPIFIKLLSVENDIDFKLENNFLVTNEPTVNIPSNVLDSDNVVLTCHTSSYDRLSVEEVGVQAINNVIHFFNNDFNKVNSFVDLY